MTEKSLTKFLILEKVEGARGEPDDDLSPVFRQVVIQNARDRDHALRLFGERESMNGTFVAVSEAAWQPRTVKVTSTPKVEISAA